MNKLTRLALTSLLAIGCNQTEASEEPTLDGAGGSFGGGGGGVPKGGAGANVPGGYGGYIPPGGGGNTGNVPGVGGYLPGGGGNIPGGGGNIPGGGGNIPGGGGNIPGGGGNIPSNGGAGGTPIMGNVDPVGNDNRAPGFINLAPPMGAPLPAQGTALSPAPPDNWQWQPIDGAICRDGSPMGIFTRPASVNKLVIYLEGGGACSNVGFCRFNPKNVNEVLGGDGSSDFGSAAGAIAGRSQPGVYSNNVPSGIFDHTNAANPFKDWNMVYVPYCTGDVHFGTRTDVTVPGYPAAAPDARDIAKHQFVGYLNMQKIIGRVVPTFSSVSQVVLTGSSAGSFGAALNFSMVQDAFGNTPVTVIGDSGAPFNDQYMYPCMQKSWRETWGLALPPDCTECQHADGGGMLGMADFLMRKHPKAKVALISSTEDEVIRLFFAVGLNNCANLTTADPIATFVAGGLMPAADYTAALMALRSQYQSTNRLATWYTTTGGPAPGLTTYHQHIFRPSFYTETGGGVTLAQFVTNFMSGTVAQVGP